MSHQPYENWIIAGEPLPPDQQYQLKEHLEACPQCRHLKCNMQAVHVKLATARQVGPAEGFKQRWQATLLERQEEQHIRQTMQIRRFFLFIGAAAVLSLILLLATFLISGVWADLLVGAANQMHTFNTRAMELKDWFFTFLQVTPPIFPIAVWVLLSMSFGILGIIWILSVWHFTLKGVKSR